MSPTGQPDARPHSRREFLGVGAVAALSLTTPPWLVGSGRPHRPGRPGRPGRPDPHGPGFGELVPDPGGMLDLPRGFQYRIVQAEEGGRLSNGAPVPADFDGMVAVDGPGNTTVLVRNHELGGSDRPSVEGRNPYDRTAPGGTTAIVVGPDRRARASYVASSGTVRNCAGGGTPWGTWITCEETRDTNHGFCFEVDPREPQNALSRTPIRDMGFFSHEAIDIDPRTGIAYLTEDDFRGEIADDPANDTRSSFLYRYLPNDRRRRPGALQAGGLLQALAVAEPSAPRDADLFEPEERFPVRWITVRPELAHDDALARGATRFNRLEGAHFAGDVLWFDDTAGGEARQGQVYRLIPGPGCDVLELFFEADSANQLDSPDNVYLTPFGDLWLAEDGDGDQRVQGITPEGEVYTFARNALNGSELCGPCFSPDGRTFFVNVQRPGITYAIWGPFPRSSAGRRRRMGHAPLPQVLRGLGRRTWPGRRSARRRA